MKCIASKSATRSHTLYVTDHIGWINGFAHGVPSHVFHHAYMHIWTMHVAVELVIQLKRRSLKQHVCLARSANNDEPCEFEVDDTTKDQELQLSLEAHLYHSLFPASATFQNLLATRAYCLPRMRRPYH